jgi:hypothetical protein
MKMQSGLLRRSGGEQPCYIGRLDSHCRNSVVEMEISTLCEVKRWGVKLPCPGKWSGYVVGGNVTPASDGGRARPKCDIQRICGVVGSEDRWLGSKSSRLHAPLSAYHVARELASYIMPCRGALGGFGRRARRWIWACRDTLAGCARTTCTLLHGGE